MFISDESTDDRNLRRISYLKATKETDDEEVLPHQKETQHQDQDQSLQEKHE